MDSLTGAQQGTVFVAGVEGPDGTVYLVGPSGTVYTNGTYLGGVNCLNPPGCTSSVSRLVQGIIAMVLEHNGLQARLSSSTAVDGYYLVAGDGGIFTFGTAQFYGSMGGHVLYEPVVGMAMTLDGKGYWLVASDGGVFTFGDAGFYGSTGGQRLPSPVTGITPTADGHGYTLTAADGTTYKFGNA